LLFLKILIQEQTMYKHILFESDDYYFNAKWANKYLDNYGFLKDNKKQKKIRLAKWNDKKYFEEEYGNDEKFKEDCREIIGAVKNKVNIEVIFYMLDSYKRLYVSVGETTPAMLYTMCPAVWWGNGRKEFAEIADVSGVEFVPCAGFLKCFRG
jgi:hypothetical protein